MWRQNILVLTQGLWDEVLLLLHVWRVPLTLEKSLGGNPSAMHAHEKKACRFCQQWTGIYVWNYQQQQKGTPSIAINNAFTHHQWIMNDFMWPTCGMWCNIASPKINFDWSLSFFYISILYGGRRVTVNVLLWTYTLIAPLFRAASWKILEVVCEVRWVNCQRIDDKWKKMCSHALVQKIQGCFIPYCLEKEAVRLYKTLQSIHIDIVSGY